MGVDHVRVAFVAGWLTIFSARGASAVAQSTVVSANTAVETTQRTVTVDVQAVQLKTALQMIARAVGLNAVFSEAVTESPMRVTLHVRNVAVEEAFAKALAGTKLRATFVRTEVLFVEQGDAMAPVAQGGIFGKIIDSKTRQGLRGATVSISGSGKGTTTIDDGGFRFSGVVPGSYTIQVRMLGYVRTSKTITVTEGQTAPLEIALEPSVNALDQVIVTGTVAGTELKAVPNAITVITAKDIEQRGITHIDQLFRGDVPGIFAMNLGTGASLGQVVMFSRGATALTDLSAGTTSAVWGSASYTNAIKTYVDGVELADPRYLGQIDPRSIERIEILSGPQASTIYGSDAINGVMQIFTKRGVAKSRPQGALNLSSGFAQNNISSALAPNHTGDIRIAGQEGRLSYSLGGSVDYTGAWTPGFTNIRTNGSGAGRLAMRVLTVEATGRSALLQDLNSGSLRNEGWADDIARGLVTPFAAVDEEGKRRSTLRGQTLGLTVGYLPIPWWSHEVVLGVDGNTQEQTQGEPDRRHPDDTTLFYNRSTSTRRSERYTTTLQFPTGSVLRTTLTAGADHWRSGSLSETANTFTLAGPLGNPSIDRGEPEKNFGSFLQGQLAFRETVFLTYGLRAEWNPNFGKDAQPNLAPRYGISYVQDVGSVTAKVRASYGRSTRPPARKLKNAISIAEMSGGAAYIPLFGVFDAQLANPDLGPEFQQGGEGGVELYFGTRGSLVITRYNQTVDNLIDRIGDADSVRSILSLSEMGYDPACCSYWTDGYWWWPQPEYLNVGSIRNQGWELQGTANLGPLNARGTYSWTKSRIIGITQQYRDRNLTSRPTFYEPGRPFDYLAEHTWALTGTYAKAKTHLSITVNGIGQLYKRQDKLMRATRSPGVIRLGAQSSPLYLGVPAGYRGVGPGYAMADLNAAHQFMSAMELTLQVLNLMDYYRNDVDSDSPTVGRQTQLGMRFRW